MLYIFMLCLLLLGPSPAHSGDRHWDRRGGGTGNGGKRAVPSFSTTELYRRTLDKFPEAVCNDGSPAVYYLPNRVPRKKQTVLLYLEPSDACYSSSSCTMKCEEYPERCTANTMSSWNPTLPIFSDSRIENPGLYHSYKISIPGCTNDVYSGTRNASYETNGLHFHGRDVLEAVLQDLVTNILDLSGPSFQFVFAGSSDGAFGVALNCDYVAETLTDINKKVDVRCIMDGIDFSNPKITTEGCDLTGRNTEATIFWESVPDTSCLVANAKDPSPCMFLSTLHPYITTPFFLAVPYHDIDSMTRPCAPYREDVRWKIEKLKVAKDLIWKHPNCGIFLSNCPHHISAESEVWDVLKVKDSRDTDISFKTAVANWLGGVPPYQVIDSYSERNPTCIFN